LRLPDTRGAIERLRRTAAGVNLDRDLSMLCRATPSDIPRIVEIRSAVRENRLSDPSRVTTADLLWQIAHSPIHLWDERCVIKGFSAGDPRDGSIFALFVDPAFEGLGIGQALILAACRSLAAAGHRVAKLSTDPATRAERFYLRNGWRAKGLDARGEMVFEKEIASEG
jgi:GNAT superfamily N-acetyltransferase